MVLIGYFFSNILCLLIAVAFYTLAERKMIGSIQRRKGPELVGAWGILQPFADGLKAILKESMGPTKIYFIPYYIAPLWVFFWSISSWFYIPTTLIFNSLICFEYSLLLLILFSTIGSLGILIAGFGSNSKYTFLGALRAISQIISYELILGLILIPIIILAGSYNLIEIVYDQKEVWNIFLLTPASIIFYITILAETNRIPFDLPEAEAELVAGYNLDYSGFLFAMFFLGEYSSMLVLSFLFILIFLGGWLIPKTFIITLKIYHYIIFKSFESISLILKVFSLSSIFIILRSVCPRYRFDQLLKLCWLKLLPNITALVYFYITLIYQLDIAPLNKISFIDLQYLFDSSFNY